MKHARQGCRTYFNHVSEQLNSNMKDPGSRGQTFFYTTRSSGARFVTFHLREAAILLVFFSGNKPFVYDAKGFCAIQRLIFTIQDVKGIAIQVDVLIILQSDIIKFHCSL